MRVCSYCHLLLGDSETACPHDGGQTRAVQVPEVPAALRDKLADFEPFAQGQTGTSYLATQPQSGYRGLLKVIPLAGFEASERVRLKRELRKQTRLAHAALPRIIDGGELGAELWLFREHVPGESLAQRIRRLGKLELPEALAITAQVASALDELQRNGLLHRDVKPGHIVLEATATGSVHAPIAKLIDSGVAARLPTGSVFDLIGTPAYISPEQVSGKLVSFRSDLYALGCVLFEMLSGQPPFPDTDVAAVLEAHKSVPAPSLELELPGPVRTLLAAMLAKEPRQRPFSAQQVRRTLEPLLPAGTPLPALGTRAPAVSKPPTRGRADTQELELEELGEPLAPAPKTLLLGDDDLEEMAVPDEPVPPFEARSPSQPAPMELVAAAEPSPEPQAAVQQRAAASSQPSVASVSDAVAHDPDASEPTLAIAGTEPEAPPQPAPAVAEPAPNAGRRAVSFDVESLFDDAVPGVPAEPESSVPTSLHEAAPTQMFRPRADDGPATVLGASSGAAAAGGHPPVADPEGTVLSARPKPIKRPLVVWVGGGAAALLALALLVRALGHRAEPPAPAGWTEESSAAAPAVLPPTGQEPVGAAQGAGQPQPEPAAAAAASQPSPEQNTAAAPTQAAAPGATEQPAQAAAEPSAAQPAGAAPTAAPAEPPATADTPRPVAQGETVSAKLAAAIPPSAERSAELAAANAAGRAQTGGGDARLASPKGSRPDRLTKAEEYKTQGRTQFQAKQFMEAAAAYERATEQNPSDPGAFAGLGASRLAAGNPVAAIAAYSRAVRLQPNSSGFHAALGRAYLQKGDRDRARSAYERALQLDPNNGAAKTAIAQLK
jgi:serine/threonine protein kinase/tetratricopeptide (TPR) repeat protein